MRVANLAEWVIALSHQTHRHLLTIAQTYTHTHALAYVHIYSASAYNCVWLCGTIFKRCHLINKKLVRCWHLQNNINALMCVRACVRCCARAEWQLNMFVTARECAFRGAQACKCRH